MEQRSSITHRHPLVICTSISGTYGALTMDPSKGTLACAVWTSVNVPSISTSVAKFFASPLAHPECRCPRHLGSLFMEDRKADTGAEH